MCNLARLCIGRSEPYLVWLSGRISIGQGRRSRGSLLMTSNSVTRVICVYWTH